MVGHPRPAQHSGDRCTRRHRRSEANVITTTSAIRTALVGGGSAGIGLATAEALAKGGTNVMLMGRTADTIDKAVASIDSEQGVDGVVADLADPAAAEIAIAATEKAFGGLDVLVVNAGGPPPGRILDLNDDQWRAASELLLLGPLRFVRRALPRMAERGFGRVVVVTSTAVRQPQPDLALSVVLRAGITSAVNLLSREFADSGVTVNCVAPGATATARREQIMRTRAAAGGLSLADLDRFDLADVPAGRPGDPGEVAAAIAFLCSDAASYVNGTVLTVDGGRTESI